MHRGRPLPILRVVGTKAPREHAVVMARAELGAYVRPLPGDTCRDLFSSGGTVTHEGSSRLSILGEGDTALAVRARKTSRNSRPCSESRTLVLGDRGCRDTAMLVSEELLQRASSAAL